MRLDRAEVCVDNVVLHTAAACPAGRCWCCFLGGDQSAAEPLGRLVDEAMEAYSRLGGEIVRHTMAVGFALDRLRAGAAR